MFTPEAVGVDIAEKCAGGTNVEAAGEGAGGGGRTTWVGTVGDKKITICQIIVTDDRETIGADGNGSLKTTTTSTINGAGSISRCTGSITTFGDHKIIASFIIITNNREAVGADGERGIIS